MTNNLIEFPNKSAEPIQAPEPNEIKEKLKQIKTEKVNEVVNALIEDFSLTLIECNLLSDSHEKNLALLVESLKAYIYKIYDLEHPLHKVAEELFTVIHTKEEPKK